MIATEEKKLTICQTCADVIDPETDFLSFCMMQNKWMCHECYCNGTPTLKALREKRRKQTP